jgi:hypothetical protein
MGKLGQNFTHSRLSLPAVDAAVLAPSHRGVHWLLFSSSRPVLATRRGSLAEILVQRYRPSGSPGTRRSGCCQCALGSLLPLFPSRLACATLAFRLKNYQCSQPASRDIIRDELPVFPDDSRQENSSSFTRPAESLCCIIVWSNDVDEVVVPSVRSPHSLWLDIGDTGCFDNDCPAPLFRR